MGRWGTASMSDKFGLSLRPNHSYYSMKYWRNWWHLYYKQFNYINYNSYSWKYYRLFVAGNSMNETRSSQWTTDGNGTEDAKHKQELPAPNSRIKVNVSLTRQWSHNTFYWFDFSVNGVDEVMGVDGFGIPTNEIIDMFIDSNNCPGMDGKLKLFLIQVNSFLSPCKWNE